MVRVWKRNGVSEQLGGIGKVLLHDLQRAAALMRNSNEGEVVVVRGRTAYTRTTLQRIIAPGLVLVPGHARRPRYVSRRSFTDPTFDIQHGNCLIPCHHCIYIRPTLCEAKPTHFHSLGLLTMLARRVVGSSRPAQYSLHSIACLPIAANLASRRFEPSICRIFATTHRHRKDVARIPQPKSTIPPQTEPKKAKVVSAMAVKPKQVTLLAEQNVSNAQQRKADWAILKEMTAYLWPKVCRRKPLDEKRAPL